MFKHEVLASQGGQLLFVLSKELPLLQRSAIRAALKRRDIRVNGERVGQNVPVAAGDALLLFTPVPMAEIPILHQDEHCLILHKPSGINSDENAQSSFSIQAWARSLKQDLRLVHRLDNQTSGLLVLAKGGEAESVFGSMFREVALEKEYECLVSGSPQPPSAQLSAYLLKDAAAGRVQVVRDSQPKAKPILTSYTCIKSGEISRLKVILHTGRTHQIRAHLAFIGHPIIGDQIYGSWTINQQQGGSLRLCATRLSFPEHCGVATLSGRTFQIKAPF